MHIVHLIENIDSRYGGPSRSVVMDCLQLIKAGHRCTIYSTRWFNHEENNLIKEYRIDWKVFDLSVKFRKASYSLGLKREIFSNINDIDILHVHCSYNYPSYLAYTAKKKYNKKVIFTLRGNLFNSSNIIGLYLKKIIWNVYFKDFLKLCDAIVVTNELDSFYLKNKLKLNTVHYVPNTLDMNSLNKENRHDAIKKLNLFDKNNYLLYMGRIHHHKGLHLLFKGLLETIKLIDHLYLIVAGPVEDKKYFKTLNKFISNNNLQNKIIFLGQVEKQTKNLLYSIADFLVHPSKSENFGMSIAESLFLGLPVIISDKTPWLEIEKFKCGYIINYNNSIKELNLIFHNIYIKNEVDINEMKLNAELYFKHFLKKNYTTSILDIYKLST